MITQAMVDACGYLLSRISAQFDGAVVGFKLSAEPLGEGSEAIRPRLTLLLDRDFIETRKLYDAADAVVDFIYRQHGVMIYFMLQQEERDDDNSV